jgi:peptidoglycan/xylan/chitin deacetylase (PgdA/CDA1 family)
VGGYVAEVKTMALTFDDGPDERWTAPLLDALARAGARATFFPIASRAAAQPGLVARMLADGHTVGLHGDEHVRHSTRDAAWGRADTERALQRLSTAGAFPTLWRTPWGDTHDWRGDAAPEMFAATRPGLRAGAIVLAHDGIGTGALRADARETVAYVELVARHAADLELLLTALR